jgi:hypothetical protein
MTAMTHPVARFADVRHHPAATVILIALFWLAAAVLVATAHLVLDPHTPAGGAAAAVVGVGGAAYCYMLFCARPGVSHALGVGIVWLTLAMVTEIAVTMRLGRAWSALLGSPEQPLLRSLFLFLWIFAPAVFARREEAA